MLTDTATRPTKNKVDLRRKTAAETTKEINRARKYLEMSLTKA